MANFTTWKTDILKPYIDAVVLRFQGIYTAMAGKEDVSNKSADGTFTAPDNTSYPSTLAVKTYVDTAATNVPAYALDLNVNQLSLSKDGTIQDSIDLSLYIDDTNLARLVSGVVDVSGLATFTRDDNTTFTVDFSGLLDNQTAVEVPTDIGTHLTVVSNVQLVLDDHQGEINALNDTENLATYFNNQF